MCVRRALFRTSLTDFINVEASASLVHVFLLSRRRGGNSPVPRIDPGTSSYSRQVHTCESLRVDSQLRTGAYRPEEDPDASWRMIFLVFKKNIDIIGHSGKRIRSDAPRPYPNLARTSPSRSKRPSPPTSSSRATLAPATSSSAGEMAPYATRLGTYTAVSVRDDP